MPETSTDNDDDEQSENNRLRRSLFRMDEPEEVYGNDLNVQQHCRHAFETEWDLGPDFTEQIIHRYAPVFAHD